MSTTRSRSMDKQEIDRDKRFLLKQLLVNANLDLSVDSVIREFCKPVEKAKPDLHTNLVFKMSRNIPEAEEAYTEVQNNTFNMQPMEMLELFLKLYATRLHKEVNVSNTASDNYSMASTMLMSSMSMKSVDLDTSATTPKTSLSDVKKRLVAAASGGLSKAARSGPLNANGSPLMYTNGNGYPSINNLMYNANVQKWGPRQIWQMKCSEQISFHPASALALPKCAQEQVMILELISCLMGNDSHYITKSLDPITNPSHLHSLTFTISNEINCSLRQIVDQMLPMGSQYAMIDEFIWQQETADVGPKTKGSPNQCSQTHQALAAALRSFLDEYMATLVQVEADAHQLTMFKVQHLLRDTQHSMSSLAESVVYIRKNDMNAAQVLSYLSDKITRLTGDDIAQQMHIFLTEKAAIPYMEMLELWILKGVILDPMNEFMLEEKPIMRNLNDYTPHVWNERYKLRPEHVPRFLEADKNMVMQTGEYLNVIRQCGSHDNSVMDIGRLQYVPNKNNHMIYIKNAYNDASKRLYKLLVEDNDLIGHMNSLKRYLLMQQGDFICQFMDTIDDELGQTIDSVIETKLKSLLELTLRLSSAKNHPYIDELCLHLEGHGLVSCITHVNQPPCMDGHTGDTQPSKPAEKLKTYECLSCKYNVHWPVSLVINDYAMFIYSTVFRMLLYFKYVDRQLNRVWIHCKNMPRKLNKISQQQRILFSLSQRMLHSVHNIEHYIMMEVVEPSWQLFMTAMNNVKDVNDVLAAHDRLYKELARDCMLYSPELIETLYGTCKICIAFSELVLVENVTEMSTMFAEKVDTLSEVFAARLKDLLDCIENRPTHSSCDRLLDLARRLKFNLSFSARSDGVATDRARDSPK